ncbi:hypothetical protein niasHT_013369 [Heterodera trifolii]|uniref:Uncharacterized protein n=1 Tax=Heterodera trifolii TaxID=157864 RepID=A0ABD2L8V1_9BILA
MQKGFYSNGKALPIPQNPLPKKIISFGSISINFIDQNVITFLGHFNRFSLHATTLNILTVNVRISKLIVLNIWPMFKDTIRLSILRLVHFHDGIFPEFPPDDSANASDGQAVAKAAFSNASSPVSFVIFVYFPPSSSLSSVMPFKLTNEFTGEKLELSKEDGEEDLSGFSLIRCPIVPDDKKQQQMINEFNLRLNQINIWIGDDGVSDGLLDGSPGLSVRWKALPIPQNPLPNKFIGFNAIFISFFDHNVLTFIRCFHRFFVSNTTKLSIDSSKPQKWADFRSLSPHSITLASHISRHLQLLLLICCHQQRNSMVLFALLPAQLVLIVAAVCLVIITQCCGCGQKNTEEPQTPAEPQGAEASAKPTGQSAAPGGTSAAGGTSAVGQQPAEASKKSLAQAGTASTVPSVYAAPGTGTVMGTTSQKSAAPAAGASALGTASQKTAPAGGTSALGTASQKTAPAGGTSALGTASQKTAPAGGTSALGTASQKTAAAGGTSALGTASQKTAAAGGTSALGTASQKTAAAGGTSALGTASQKTAAAGGTSALGTASQKSAAGGTTLKSAPVGGASALGIASQKSAAGGAASQKA